MSGQMVDAAIVAAPRQRNTEQEKAAIRAGRIPEAWRDKPAKLAQKDRDGRWTLDTKSVAEGHLAGPRAAR